MSDETPRQEQAKRRRLRKSADFRDEIERRGQAELRKELALPNIDAILKELQDKYGVRIALSPNLVAKLEESKARAADQSTLASGCFSTDVCILCDHGDICSTCDTTDWCVWNDTHLV